MISYAVEDTFKKVFMACLHLLHLLACEKMLFAQYIDVGYHLKNWKLSCMFVQNTIAVIL